MNAPIRHWSDLSTADFAAIDRIQEIVERCRGFSLRQLTYQYPVVYEGGETPMDKLIRLTWEGAKWRYPEGVPDKVASTMKAGLR